MGALFEPFVWIIGILVDVYFTVVLVEIVVHWLLHFKVVDLKNVYIAKTVSFLNKVTEPVYKKIAEKIPAVKFNGFDFSPFILMLGLLFLSRFVYRLDLMLM